MSAVPVQYCCMFRIIHLARDYSNKRVAFGKLIAHHSLHMQTLARMEVILYKNCYVHVCIYV